MSFGFSVRIEPIPNPVGTVAFGDGHVEPLKSNILLAPKHPLKPTEPAHDSRPPRS